MSGDVTTSCLPRVDRICNNGTDEAGFESGIAVMAGRDVGTEVYASLCRTICIIVLHYGSQSLNTSSLVTLDPPAALAPRVLNALKADPRIVDLRALAPHFYDLGARILDLFEEEEMIEVLSDTFKARAAVIADQAHNPRGALGEGADFMRGLDENERKRE